MPEKIHDFKNAASTASLIFVNDNKLLLIQRDHEPFAGMWALPGGFLNCDQETLEQAAIREFYEETNLVTHIDKIQLFSVNSSPVRDPRGHVIDHVYVVLAHYGEMKAKDDARAIAYFDLNNLPPLAFDHGDVVKAFRLRFEKRVYED
jgi:8-oxo-dGTP diphosphatase